MADPSQTELETQLSNVIHMLEETRKFAEVNSGNWVALEDTYTQSLETDFAARATVGVASARTQLNAILSGGRALVDPVISAFSKFLNIPITDPVLTVQAMYTQMIGASRSVKTRDITFGTPAGGGNTGDGTIHRLTVDEQGLDIESIHIEVKVADLVIDHNQAANKNEEVWRIRGEAAGVDELVRSGSNVLVNLSAVSARQQSFLRNASFDTFGGTTTAPTSLSDWTSNKTVSSAFFAFDTTNVFHPARDSSVTPASIEIKASGTELKQTPSDNGFFFTESNPVHFQIAYNPDSSGSGTLTLTLGSVSSSISFFSSTSDWKVFSMTLSKERWFGNFNTDPLEVKVTVTTLATGTILLDDVILEPYTLIDNTWYLAIGGATAWMNGDELTWTDTATDSIIQRWIWRLYNEYLPHDSSPTLSDP